jgi:hypothetical protein
MKKIEIEVSEKMYAAIEAFEELWEYKNLKSTAEELLKGGIEDQIRNRERFPKDYEIIEKVMNSKGFEWNINDMDVYKYPWKDRRH